MPNRYRMLAFAVLLTLLTSAGVTLAPKLAGGQGSSPYAKYFVWDYLMQPLTPEMEAKMKEDRIKQQTTVEATRLLNMNTKRIEGSPYLDFVWLWKGNAKGYNEKQHYHEFDEFIGFIGTKGGQQDPQDLGGEMEVWLGSEKYSITRELPHLCAEGAQPLPDPVCPDRRPYSSFRGPSDRPPCISRS